jgi:hypothetical protein
MLLIVSKWFYNISTGIATKAARCDSLFGEGLGRLYSSYEESTMDTMIYVVRAADV